MLIHPLLAHMLRARLNVEKSETRTIGDVRIDVVERGNRIVHLKVHHSGRVPDVLGRFDPEVREKALSQWWSTARERRILRAAKTQGSLVHDIVRGALVHDRAVTIERRMQRQRERAKKKSTRETPIKPVRHRLPFRRPLQPQLGPRSRSALAHPQLGSDRPSLVETIAASHELPQVNPRVLPDRLRTQPATRSGTALGHPEPGKRSLVETIAAERDVPLAEPRPAPERLRSR
jgi:hypothetical protein